MTHCDPCGSVLFWNDIFRARNNDIYASDIQPVQKWIAMMIKKYGNSKQTLHGGHCFCPSCLDFKFNGGEGTRSNDGPTNPFSVRSSNNTLVDSRSYL